MRVKSYLFLFLFFLYAPFLYADTILLKGGEEIKGIVVEEYGDRLVFWGGIDTQHVLPFGTVAEVREEVRRRIHDLAQGGGYMLTAVHNIQPDVPPENICAMYEAALEFGQYPIQNRA